MNKFFKIILLFILGIFVVSCSKDDNNDTKVEPLHDYAEQYATDIANIETFLKNHYIEVIDNPGAANDMDVSYHEIPTGGTQIPIWDSPDLIKDYKTKVYYDSNDNTKFQEYTVYYLKLRQGSGTNSKSPCNVDKVLTSYRGEFIKDVTGTDGVKAVESTFFEELVNPQSYFDLTTVIRGWSEIFPKFKTGSYSGNTDGTISYTDFGAGVMFLPSGLAYYNQAKGTIPAYSPLIFSFKLYEIQRADQDGDGIPSYQEDIDGDGYVRVFPTKPTPISNPDNSDAISVLLSDGIKYSKTDETPDFIDTDDDGDYFTTKSEIKNPLTELPYPFDEIPTCGDGGNGKKKHLDPSCH